VIQRWWSHGFNSAYRGGFLFEDGGRHTELTLPGKRALARQHLVQHSTQRKYVAPPVQLFSLPPAPATCIEMFRTTVPCSVTGEFRVAAVNVTALESGTAGLANPKSSSFAPVGVNMMLPLQIPVHHAAAMRFVQRVRNLHPVLQYLLQRQGPFFEALRQRLTFDAFITR